MPEVITPGGLPTEPASWTAPAGFRAPEPLGTPEPSTAAEHDGKPVAHSHGAHGPHVHTAESYAAHQRPIVDERVYARLPDPDRSPPATSHDGPYAAASVLRSWAAQLDLGHVVDRDLLARDLRGAASILDGVTR